MKRIKCNIGEEYQIMLQEPSTPYMIGISELNDRINYYLIIIITLVIIFIGRRINKKRGIINIKYINHSKIVEIIWTIIPGIIIIIIGIPSIKLLYGLDEIVEPEVTIKIKGIQWYWNYEISDINKININYDSYTDSEGQIRLLDVDNRLKIPILTPIRLLITSEDVIHSFAIPSLGIKTDAIPGRINSTNIILLKKGVYYGQCSELCGTSHNKMSIVIEGITKKEYIEWLTTLI